MASPKNKKRIKEFKFHEIVDTIIGEINEAKKRSSAIHQSGNIKSSGDEVENLIREKISLFLPERYLVKQGHIVNSEGMVSHQFDLIIFDRLNTPKFFESKNNTVFYPIESVLAVGEIKKTLRKGDLTEFGKKIEFLKTKMKRKLIPNTAYGGKLKGDESLADIVNMRTDRKYKNPLFSFVFAIDEENIKDLSLDDAGKFMPNDVYILNYGFYMTGEIKDGLIHSKIEDEESKLEHFIEIRKTGVVCLATMLNQLINHLNSCCIEPFGLSAYMTDVAVFGIRGYDLKQYNLQ